MSEHTHSFGYWLRRRRRALDLTQEQLAQAVACSHFAIRKIEADERRPSQALAERLAGRLGVPPGEHERFMALARGKSAGKGLTVDDTPVSRPSREARHDANAARPADIAPAATAPWTMPPAHPFVGRATELDLLDGALARARAGTIQIVVLSGPGGIGKTSLAQAVAARAADAGMSVLWGRCPEEPGAPPFWPWVQVFRSHAERRGPSGLLADMGAGAHRIADIVPELKTWIDTPSPAVPTDPAQARFQLFDAIAAFCRQSTARLPGCVILDDLHWADASTLRLLEFLAAHAGKARMLVLATCRDVADDRRHPLFDTLAALSRLPNCIRHVLGGLDLDDARLLATGEDLPDRDLVHLHAQAEGNPLYLKEMVRFLATPEAARGAARLPRGVREAIGVRLNRLSADCNRVLGHAAVIGRDFELAVLTRMDDSEAGQGCHDAIEEALDARVIEETAQPGWYRFTHGLIRETLYDELSAIRRARLHFAIANALEAGSVPGTPTQYSRLAFHFGAAMPAQGVEQALDYAQRAAEGALRVLAYEEAARHLGLALDALAIRERNGSLATGLRCLLRVRQGEAQVSAGDFSAARETLRAAADLAMANDLGALLARAAIAFEDASWRPGEPGLASIALLRSALERMGTDVDDRSRARLLAALTRALIFSGAATEAFATADEAVAAARRSGDPSTLVSALLCPLSARWHPERIEARLDATAEALRVARHAGRIQDELETLPWRLFDLGERGLDAAFDVDYARYRALVEEVRQPFHTYTSQAFGPALALMRGDLVASEREAGALLSIGETQPGLDAAGVHAIQIFSVRREQGRLHELAPLVQHFVANTSVAERWRPGLALVFAELGMAEAARREFEALACDDFSGIARDAMWVASMAYLAEVCAFLGDARRAETLYRLLLPWADRNLLAGTSVACFGAASRHLGMLSRTSGRLSDAERHLHQAIADNTRQGAVTWTAHAQYQLAITLLARDSADGRKEAARLVEEARSTARRTGLEALTARLDALDPPATRNGRP